MAALSFQRPFQVYSANTILDLAWPPWRKHGRINGHPKPAYHCWQSRAAYHPSPVKLRPVLGWRPKNWDYCRVYTRLAQLVLQHDAAVAQPCNMTPLGKLHTGAGRFNLWTNAVPRSFQVLNVAVVQRVEVSRGHNHLFCQCWKTCKCDQNLIISIIFNYIWFPGLPSTSSTSEPLKAISPSKSAPHLLWHPNNAWQASNQDARMPGCTCFALESTKASRKPWQRFSQKVSLRLSLSPHALSKLVRPECATRANSL